MESSLKAHLLDCAQQYGASNGLAASTIGRLAAADGRFFERLCDGKTFTVRKYDEVLEWFRLNWPADVPFPELGSESEPLSPEAQHA